MIPQINLDRGSWHPQAELLAARGMVALPIDEGSQRVAATLAATEYLRTEHGVDQVILLGASSGGEAAIVAGATAPDRVDGVITLSAAGGVDHAASLTGQQLFVVSRADEQRFVDVTDTLGDTVASSRTVSYDGSAHGQALFAGPHRQDLWTHVHTLTTTVC